MLLKQQKQKNGDEQKTAETAANGAPKKEATNSAAKKGKPMCTAGRSMSGFSIKAPYSKILTISS